MKQQRQHLRWLAVACPLLIGFSLLCGPGWATPFELFEPALRGVLEIRAWRILLACIGGASLALSGVILQAILRNPLAEPYILGVSAGAGVGAATAIAFGGVLLGVLALPAGGFIGGMISLLAVYLIARIDRRTAPYTLILAGVAWGALCSSILMFFVSRSTAEGLHAVSWWFLGDLQVFDPVLVVVVAGINGLVMAAVLLQARALDALTLGDDLAGHLGLRTELRKIVLLALATLLAATSVSACGLIAFVGLIVPHVARGLVGPGHRRLFPAAILIGAAFLTVVDALGRTLFYPIEVPVGIFTALVGAPFFLVLLRRKRRDMWGHAS